MIINATGPEEALEKARKIQEKEAFELHNIIEKRIKEWDGEGLLVVNLPGAFKNSLIKIIKDAYLSAGWITCNYNTPCRQDNSYTITLRAKKTL